MFDKWKFYEAFGYKTYDDRVRQFHDSSARCKVVVTPRRCSKSYSAAYDVLPDAMKPGAVIWIVGPNYSLAEKEFRYIHEALCIKAQKIGFPKPTQERYNVASGAMRLHWKKPLDITIEAKSADNPTGLLGDAVDVIIYSESAELARGIRERYCEPTLNTKKGREIIPTTPQVKAEWVFELWEKGQKENDIGIETFHWDGHANPKYDWDEFNRAKRFYGADHPVFREQYMGEWVFYGGVVFPTFNEQTHVIDPFDIPRHWPVIRGIDFGMRDPFVCLWAAVGDYGELYVFQEYYCTEGRSMREHASIIRGMSEGYKIQNSVADPESPQSIEDLAFEKISCEPANNDRQAGRMRFMEYLLPTDDAKPPLPLRGQNKILQKFPRLYIFTTCKETRREFKFYRWKEGRAVEGDKEKTEGDDHAMDCLRYISMTRPSPFKPQLRIIPGSFNSVLNKIRNSRLREMAGLRR